MNEIQKRIEELRKEIQKHDELYEKNTPIISDAEYDRLYQELVQLETQYPEYYSPDSPTQKIYTVMVKELKKVSHETYIGSQEKAHSFEDIQSFVKRANEVSTEILCQYKMDGLTVVLRYLHGKLVQAVTRGDGYVGEDVTHTVQTIRNVPKRIPFEQLLEVRMEAIIPYEEFERINQNGMYSNPRNLASGTLRQLDSRIAEQRGLQGFVFELVRIDGMNFQNDTEQLSFLQQQGFTIVPTKVFPITEEGLQQLHQYIQQIEKHERSQLPYLIDGLVLKFNSLSLREELGSTAKHPRWSVAYKFEAQDATTKLLAVTPQVGKSGQITPVGELEAVTIAGVTIRRATLHNYQLIKEKDIRIGDTVTIIRANDVTPKITSPIKEKRDGSEKVIEPPTHCPECGSPTEWDGANLYCTGVDCKPQLQAKIEHFGSKQALNIDGLGKKTVSLFFEKGIIQHFLDLYRLEEQKEKILQIKGFGVKKLEKLLKQLEEAKKAPLHKVLFALSIRHLGEVHAKELAKKFKDMTEILHASKDKESFAHRIRAIPEFGEAITNSIVDFFTNPQNRQIIEQLQSLGFTMKSEYTSTPEKQQILQGKIFVITGELSKPREEFKALIEQLGGKVTNSVSKKTSYLLMGENATGTSKHQKALSLHIPIIKEKDFLRMIQE